MEQSLSRALSIVAQCGSPQQQAALGAHMEEWNNLIGELADKYPASEQSGGIGGEK
jgi:hypothetical protein